MQNRLMANQLDSSDPGGSRMNMERQSSRRRKPAPVEEQQPQAVADQPSLRGSQEPDRTNYLQSAIQNRALVILFSSLVVCLLIVFVYIDSNGDRSFHVLLSPSHSKSHGSSLSPSTLQLHPEDHIFREPTTQYLDWRISSGDRRPDGARKRVYLINGELLAAVPMHS